MGGGGVRSEGLERGMGRRWRAGLEEVKGSAVLVEWEWLQRVLCCVMCWSSQGCVACDDDDDNAGRLEENAWLRACQTKLLVKRR